MRATRWMPFALTGLGAMACDAMAPGEPGNLVPRTVAEDASLPAIDMNGSRFHLETFGNPANPVIVFLHGGPGGDYRSMLRLAGRYDGYSLADHYFLVFWDQRGAGLSRRHDRHVLTTDVYVEDLNALVDRYAPGGQVFLVGESWGGMFATLYINQHPQRVAGAVLIEPGPMDGATMERLKSDIAGMDLLSEWVNDVAWSSQFFTPDDHARMDYARAMGARQIQPRSRLSTVDPAPSWRAGAAANTYIVKSGQDGKGRFNYDFTTDLAAYTTPVLFIAGSLSEVLGPSLQQVQVQNYPSASLQVITGAGHDVAWVRAAETLTHIRAYLDSLGGSQ